MTTFGEHARPGRRWPRPRGRQKSGRVLDGNHAVAFGGARASRPLQRMIGGKLSAETSGLVCGSCCARDGRAPPHSRSFHRKQRRTETFGTIDCAAARCNICRFREGGCPPDSFFAGTGCDPAKTASLWVNSVADRVNSVTDLTQKVTDLTQTVADLIKSITDLIPIITDLTRSAIDLTSIVTDLTQTMTDLTQTVTDLTQIVADLTQTMTDLTRSVIDLTPKVTNLTGQRSDPSFLGQDSGWK